MADLRKIQHHLERIYEVKVDEDVDQFLITEAALARHYDRGPSARDTPEKLLVHQESETLNLALYLDEALMERLHADDPTQHLHDGNLGTFWTVLEGISHFLYLVWNAGHGRSVTLFELELQAEVDKFVVAALLIGRQCGGRIPSALHPRLFARPVFDSNLDHATLIRYHRANHYASRYCALLQEHFLKRRRGAGIFNELRRFYRLMHRKKLDRIRTLHYAPCA